MDIKDKKGGFIQVIILILIFLFLLKYMNMTITDVVEWFRHTFADVLR